MGDNQEDHRVEGHLIRFVVPPSSIGFNSDTGQSMSLAYDYKWHAHNTPWDCLSVNGDFALTAGEWVCALVLHTGNKDTEPDFYQVKKSGSFMTLRYIG